MDANWLTGLLRHKLAVADDGKVTGDHYVANITKQKAGKRSTQIGQARDVTIECDK